MIFPKWRRIEMLYIKKNRLCHYQNCTKGNAKENPSDWMKELQTLTQIHTNERAGKSNSTYKHKGQCRLTLEIMHLVPHHSNKANISIKQVTWFFNMALQSLIIFGNSLKYCNNYQNVTQIQSEKKCHLKKRH